MTCPDREGLLHLLDGTAGPAGRSHLAGCPGCARSVEVMRRLRGLAGGADFRTDPAVAPALRRAKRRRRALRVQQALGTAAGLLLCAVLCAGEALRVRVEQPRLAGGEWSPVAAVGSHGR